MKKVLFTLIGFLACTSAHAREPTIKLSEPQLWEALYNGEYSLAHKMVLCRPSKETNDEILSLVMMHYLRYREGDEEVLDLFHHIDSMVEGYYIHKSY